MAGAAAPSANAASLDDVVHDDLGFAQSQARDTLTSVPEGRYPFYTGAGGEWVTASPRVWVAGLFPGELWLLYRATGDPFWGAAAADRQAPLAEVGRDRSSHDLGFIVFDSFGNGYRATGEDGYRRVVLRAADSLAARFDPVVGAIRSRNSPAARRRTVIIDNLLNTELLFWASKHGGDPAWYWVALSDALKTARDHLRADGSTRQAVRYDWRSGRITGRPALQASGKHTVWARGQAWGLYGFTMAYRESGDPRLLEAARRAADWFLSHLPADHVPYWDFLAPGIPSEPRDSSAAAIAASGLYELAALDPDGARYRDGADAIMASLSSEDYLAAGKSSRAIILHGTQQKKKGNFDTGLIHGDYFFLEALLRRLSPPSPPAHPTEVVVDGASPGVRKGLNRGVRLEVRTSEAGRIRAALIPRRKTARALGRNGRHLDVVGRGSAQAAEPGWTTIRVPISRRGRRHLRHRSSAKLVVSVVLEGADGGSDATAASLKLSRR